MGDGPGLEIQEALGWVIYPHNMYPGLDGWSSFQLMLGGNSRISGVGGKIV